MSDIFKEILSADESLFVNEIALDFDYLPKELQYRENQQHYLAECIAPLFNKRLGKNILITGKPGIGKTAAVKFILREMEDKGLEKQAFPLYINCWKKETAHKIVLEICDQLGYKWVQNKKTDEIFKEIAEIINKKAAVIVLDEVDKIDSDQFIYQLLEDIYHKTIFMITNNKEWLSDVDSRVRSRLVPEIVEFHPYNLAETRGILNRRVESAFVPNIWDEQAFDMVVKKCYELNDIRSGIFLLRQSGLMAESKASRKILPEHSEKAIEKLVSMKIRSSNDFTDEEKYVHSLVKQLAGKTATEMYSEYKKVHDKSYRTFYRKIKELEEAGLVEIEDFVSDVGGRSSIIRPKR